MEVEERIIQDVGRFCLVLVEPEASVFGQQTQSSRISMTVKQDINYKTILTRVVNDTAVVLLFSNSPSP